MSYRYSFETEKMLDDFLIHLENNTDVNPAVLIELRGMVDEGCLGEPAAIKTVIQMLKDQHYDLQD